MDSQSLDLYPNKVIYHIASCSIDNWHFRILQSVSETVKGGNYGLNQHSQKLHSKWLWTENKKTEIKEKPR